jgi:gliding motility-associated-like protein
MKKLLLLNLLVLLCCSTGQAQFQNGLWTGKQAYNWYFPVEAGISFETSPPTALTNGLLNTDPDEEGNNTEASATISDSDGNLLFYTNGITVWNKNHQVMENGTGLLGSGTSTQGALIIPKPGSENIYYIFVTKTYDRITSEAGYVTYSEIDMSLDSGLGAVTDHKNITVLQPANVGYFKNEEKLAAVHHADGQSIWVAARQDNIYYTFLVSTAGVTSSPNVSTAGIGSYGLFSPGGEMKFSSDGHKLVTVNPGSIGDPANEFKIEIFNFNNATGYVTGPLASIDVFVVSGNDIRSGYGVYSIEFSPNGRYLYVMALSHRLYQFDLSSNDQDSILASATLISEEISEDFYVYLRQMQTGSDGKIYISNLAGTSLHVLNYPNNAGLAAGYQENALSLAGKESGEGLPDFIASYFQSGILHEGECANQDITFSTIRIPNIESIEWDFGDPASGAANTSADLEPAHSYQNVGTYTVTAIITSNGAQQTATTIVTILPAPVAVPPQGATLVQCADANGNTVFNLTQYNSVILAGQDASAFTVSYYANEADLQANTPVVNATGQTVYAQVVNNTTGCFANTSFTLVVNPMPVATTPNDMEVCANTTGEAVFKLTNQDAAILGNQNPTLFSVTYYASQQDLQNNNPIAVPEAFASSGQMIFALVSAIAGSNCTPAITRFNITALPAPSIIDVIEYTGCSPFNLIAITAEEGEGLDLTFYNNEDDAIAGSNAIVTTESYNVQGNAATLYVAAKNAQGCTDISEIQLAEGDCNIPRGISPNNDGYNDSLDLSGFNVAQLSIFNRYGAKVFSRTNYIDQWHGQADDNNELPTGTYYYSIKIATGEEKTGWVYINREIN